MNTNLSNGTAEEDDLPHPLEFIAAEEKFRRSGGYDYGKVFASKRELKLIKAAYNLGYKRCSDSLGSMVRQAYEKAELDEPDWINLLSLGD